MKTLLNISLIFAMMFFSLCPALAEELLAKKITPHIGPAAVKGTVVLQSSPKGVPSDLEELYLGRDSKLPVKPRIIKVLGTYDSGNSVTVTEDLSVSDSVGTYNFTVPLIESIINTFSTKLTKESSSNRSIIANFANKIPVDGDSDDGDDDSDEDSDDDDDTTDSVNETISNVPIRISKTMSVSKLIASRKGNKAKLKGKFSKEGAKGRFALNFAF